jgi:hypothetical protein
VQKTLAQWAVCHHWSIPSGKIVRCIWICDASVLQKFEKWIPKSVLWVDKSLHKDKWCSFIISDSNCVCQPQSAESSKLFEPLSCRGRGTIIKMNKKIDGRLDGPKCSKGKLSWGQEGGMWRGNAYDVNRVVRGSPIGKEEQGGLGAQGHWVPVNGRRDQKPSRDQIMWQLLDCFQGFGFCSEWDRKLGRFWQKSRSVCTCSCPRWDNLGVHSSKTAWN